MLPLSSQSLEQQDSPADPSLFHATTADPVGGDGYALQELSTGVLKVQEEKVYVRWQSLRLDDEAT